MAQITKKAPIKEDKKVAKKVVKKEEIEKSPIDLLLDENNSENIVLYDEKNKRTTFEQVAIIPIKDVIYAILKPVDKISGVEDDQALVFVIEELDGESCLSLVDDDNEDNNKIIDEVFEQYYELLRKEGLIK